MRVNAKPTICCGNVSQQHRLRHLEVSGKSQSPVIIDRRSHDLGGNDKPYVVYGLIVSSRREFDSKSKEKVLKTA